MNKLQVAFFEYASNYDIEEPHIMLKAKHMQRVEKIARFIAKEIGLTAEEIEVAGTIGLLHDIGRFYQMEHYNTFSDSDSIDHAEASNIVLFTEGHLEDFIGKKMTKKYGEVIRKAIFYHNKLALPDDTSSFTNLELTMAKLIRDADKIDIFKIFLESGFSVAFQLKEGANPASITPEIEDAFYKKGLVDYSLRKSYIDEYIAKLAYVFDFNFDVSKKLLVKTGYLEQITKALFEQVNIENEDTRHRVLKILDFAISNLQEN